MKRLTLAPLLAFGWLLAGCFGQEQPRNVLLVTIDTLRADRLACYGYPNAITPHLDNLAGRGLRFTQASSVTPLTLPAHSSLMTGTFPAFHGVRDNGGFYLGEEHETLAERFKALGFRTGGFVAAFVLDSRWGIAQGFDHYFDAFDLSKFKDAQGMDAIQRPAAAVVDQALPWLDLDQDQPFFAWIHFYDPHTPYEAPSAWRARFPNGRDGAYDAEIASADEQLGRLLAALERSGRLAETLVVVTSDHGEMLGEHQEQTHGFFIYEAAIRVPLLIAGPGIPTQAIDDPVRLVDLLPTILARFGEKPAAAVQGADLAPLWQGRPLRLVAHAESFFPRFHYGWSELQSLRDGQFKLIQAPRPELYDLARDPHELNNLAESDPQRRAAMSQALERLLERIERQEGALAPQALDSETEARLRALGYLGGARARNLEKSAEGDPKDKIALYNRLKEASAAAATDKLDLAFAKLDEALAADPKIVEAHVLRGNFERKAERIPAAIAAFQEALHLDPDHDEALYNLSIAYKDDGRLDDAAAFFARARQLDARNGKVLWQIADIKQRQGKMADAEAELKQALELDLDQAGFLTKLAEVQQADQRPDQAEKSIRAALEKNPEQVQAHFILGLVLEDQERFPEAIAAYQQEIEKNPDAFRANFNLAKILQKSGRTAEAAERFRQVTEQQPKFGTGYLYLAKALLDSGDLEGAAQAAQRGLDNQPEKAIAPLGYFVLADIFNRQGKIAAAARAEAEGRRLQRDL
jgi:arylsulfatase A-like enzyme/lipopolysaccharide biosynthesis regulator YciM